VLAWPDQDEKSQASKLGQDKTYTIRRVELDDVRSLSVRASLEQFLRSALEFDDQPVGVGVAVVQVVRGDGQNDHRTYKQQR